MRPAAYCNVLIIIFLKFWFVFSEENRVYIIL